MWVIEIVEVVLDGSVIFSTVKKQFGNCFLYVSASCLRLPQSSHCSFAASNAGEEGATGKRLALRQLEK
jgi:hypothetical protein